MKAKPGTIKFEEVTDPASGLKFALESWIDEDGFYRFGIKPAFKIKIVDGKRWYFQRVKRATTSQYHPRAIKPASTTCGQLLA